MCSAEVVTSWYDETTMERDDHEVGIRDLKSHTSSILRRVSAGETITVTVRNQPVALLIPVRAQSQEDLLRALVSAGKIAWSGGKPRGCKNAPRTRGPSVSDAVIEDRR